MWKLLTMLFGAALLAWGPGQAAAFPVQNTAAIQHAAPGVTLARHKGNYHHHHNYYRYRYPYYRRYYRPSYAWNYCGWGWGYGYWPSDCFAPGFYGGYYGGYYYDRYDYPRHHRVSNKKHVKWCKARYKTYNVKTNTFIGKGKKAYRCNSPYDGRR